MPYDKKDDFLIIDEFRQGWHKRVDASRVPIGGSQKSVNITLTDRGGIGPRQGELLLGSDNTAQAGTKSLYSFKRADGSDVLLKSYSTKLEFYHPDVADWVLLQDNYTSGLTFGFREHTINTDQVDLIYGGNGIDPYFRWNGWYSRLNGALSGGETEVIVDGVLTANVHFTGTASSVTTTTLTMPAGTWAADIWNDFYVRITSGAKSGFISKITATTATQITFGTITGLTGTPTFEIRQLGVPATGTLVYNDQTVAYTGVPRDDRFTVASAHAGSDNAGITVAPIEYKSGPRGNLFDTLHESMYVAGDVGAPNSLYRSALADATDFSFSSPRSADQGDITWFPYGGSKITDIHAQESSMYVFKPSSIEGVTYTQDGEDLVNIDPITQGVGKGSIGRTWKMGDDIAFGTSDNRITTLGRVVNRDQRPQVTDIAFPIRREVKNYNFDSLVGVEYTNRGFVGVKATSVVTANNRLLVYNKDYRAWEGYWNVNAGSLAQHNDLLYYGDSFTPNVYQLLTGTNKVKGSNTFPISCEWQSGFINTRGSGFYINEVSCLAVEGYITSGTTINFKLFKDFATSPFRELTLSGSETQFQDNVPTFNLLGVDPLGTNPLGASSVLGDEDTEGRRHFLVFLYFPITQLEYISVSVGSSGKNQDWEVIALGINATENVFENLQKIKDT
jgi:hypothetical protein